MLGLINHRSDHLACYSSLLVDHRLDQMCDPAGMGSHICPQRRTQLFHVGILGHLPCIRCSIGRYFRPRPRQLHSIRGELEPIGSWWILSISDPTVWPGISYNQFCIGPGSHIPRSKGDLGSSNADA